MRKIEFRGISTENGDLIYGDLVQDAINAYSKVIAVGIKSKGLYPTEVKPETVGQYTGLKDKNGIEIYEGDILTDGEKKYKVVFADACFWSISNANTHWVKYLYDCKRMDVIGNIYQNPELLNS